MISSMFFLFLPKTTLLEHYPVGTLSAPNNSFNSAKIVSICLPLYFGFGVNSKPAQIV